MRVRMRVILMGACLGIVTGPTALGETSGTDAPTTDAGPLCLLALEEMRQLTGADLVSMAGSGLDCAYQTAPDADLMRVDLRLWPPDPTAGCDLDDPLLLVRYRSEAGGRDVVVGGLPAWQSDDGLWVDLGADLFAVEPLFFLADDPPAVADVVGPIAELALPRIDPTLLAVPRPVC